MPDVQQKSQAYSVQEPEEEEVAEDFILGPASSVRFARLTAPGIRNRRGFAVDPVHGTRKANGEKRGRNIDQRRPLTDQRKVVWFCTSEIPDLAAHRFIPFNKTWIYLWQTVFTRDIKGKGRDLYEVWECPSAPVDWIKQYPGAPQSLGSDLRHRVLPDFIKRHPLVRITDSDGSTSKIERTLENAGQDRKAFVERRGGSPQGCYMGMLSWDARRLTALVSYWFGHTNSNPCRCCIIKYELHTSGRGAPSWPENRVLWPFGECASHPVLGGGACCNCQWNGKTCDYKYHTPKTLLPGDDVKHLFFVAKNGLTEEVGGSERARWMNLTDAESGGDDIESADDWDGTTIPHAGGARLNRHRVVLEDRSPEYSCNVQAARAEQAMEYFGTTDNEDGLPDYVKGTTAFKLAAQFASLSFEQDAVGMGLIRTRGEN